MKSTRTAPSQAQASARRAYSAPTLTTFGSVASLTAGGASNASENGQATASMPMRMMRA